MRRAVALVALAALSIAPACVTHDPAPGEAKVRLSGRAQVGRVGGRWHDLQTPKTLRRGDRIRVEQGSARVQLSGRRSLELRAGSEVELGADLDLFAGDVLATAASTALTITSAGTTARAVGGTSRFSRKPALVAAVYSGSVDIESGGRRLHVPALRQVVAVGLGLLPGRPSPLASDPADGWDQRFLGDAMKLDEELVARSRAFSARLGPGEGRTAGFYRLVLPPLEREPAFDQSLLSPWRSPGETLVGASIAVEDREGPFRSRWDNVFAFRDQGAGWGLVALDHDVGRARALSRIDVAMGRASSPVASAAPNPVALPQPVPPTQGRLPSRPAVVSPPPPATAPPAGTTPSSVAPPTTSPASGGGDALVAPCVKRNGKLWPRLHWKCRPSAKPGAAQR